MPDVVGQTQADATSALEAAGLEARVRNVPSEQAEGHRRRAEPAGRRAHGKGLEGADQRVPAAAPARRRQRRPRHGDDASEPGAGRPCRSRTSSACPSPTPGRACANAGLRADPKPVPVDRAEEHGRRPVPGCRRAGQARRVGPRERLAGADRRSAVPDVTGDDETTATTKLENAGFTVKVVRAGHDRPVRGRRRPRRDACRGRRREAGREGHAHDRVAGVGVAGRG